MTNKLFSDLVNFSRGTGATRVNSAGLIVGVDFSTTSNTIATGSKTFTLAADANVNRDWPVGSNVIAVAQAGATGSMTGTVTSYTPSTQSLVINVVSVTGSGTSTDWRIGSLEMREDYDPVTLVRRGVLSEVAATNLLTFSDNFLNAAWGLTGTTVSSGGLNVSGSSGQVLVEDATNSVKGIGRTIGVINGENYVISFCAKKTTARYICLASGANFGFSGVYFDFDTESVVGSFSNGALGFSFVKLSNGYFRFTLLRTVVGGGSGAILFYLVSPTQNFTAAISAYQGSVTSSVQISQFEIVQNTSQTSIIPTTSAQVTRNADNFPLTATALTSIRQGESTLYAEIDCPDTGVAQKRALRLSGTNADIRIGKQGTGTLSNFTKMAEGAGLRLMGTANSLIRGNGQEMLPLVTAIDQRSGTAVTSIPSVNAVAFDGVNRFAISSGSEEIYLDNALSVFSGRGSNGIEIRGAHHSGNRFLAASGGAGIVFVSDGTSYRRINTPVITQGTNEVTSGLVGGTLRNVIVGDGGFIATSDDNGETWTSRTSGTAQNIRGVTFGAGSFVAAAANGTQSILTSPDGVTWTRQTTPNVSLVDVHFANSIYVATSNAGVVLTSTNGTTWIAATATNTNQALNGVTYSTALNLWIVVGVAGTIITATDPAGTWTVQTSGTTQNLNEVTIFNSAIYIVGNTQTLLTSTNGTSYTSLTAGVTANLAGIAASPTTLLITGSAGAMASSTDGTTFTSRTNNNNTLNGIAFGNNTFVSAGNSTNGSGYIATIGADGTVTRRVSGLTNGLLNVKFVNGAFYATHSVGVTRSVDGISWVSTNLINSNLSVASSGSIFVAVGSTGRASTSTDGITWVTGAANSLGNGQQFNDVDFANGIFVAVGNAGSISTSPNGTTWTLRTSNTTANLNSVMFSQRDQLWYAAGNGGVLLYSPDAITWTAVQNSGTASILGTTLQSNQPLPQFKSGVNKIGISYKSNQVISALNGITSSTDITASIPSITAGNIGENLNGYIRKIDIYTTALTAAEMSAKTL